ncbi:MAG: glycosyltransferase family 39 protein [Candidatus Polarisedimenticolaceae bacterium]|nr:glycosyltransferase family 39 protein [Candidatus Polarisedimenticolaceae bacterium]
MSIGLHKESAKSGHLWIIASAILLQIIAIWFLPVIEDEAYFVSWGDHLSGGYYDHPPMTGWIAYLLSYFQHEELLLRLLSLSMGLSLLALFAAIARRLTDPLSALTIAIAWYVLPVNMLAFGMYLNDTIVTFLSILFVCCSYLSIKSEQNNPTASYIYALLAGVILGLAMLTKYLAAMYVIALVIFLFINFSRYQKFILTKLSIIALVSTALFCIHLYWNYNNCTINFAFNFLHRKKGTPLGGAIEFILTMMVILGPVLTYRMVRHYSAFKREDKTANSPPFFIPLFFIILLVVFSASVASGHFGIHWGIPLSFFGLLAVAEANRHPPISQALMRYNFGYAALFYAILFAALWVLGSNLLSDNKAVQKAQQSYGFYQDLTNGHIGEALNRRFPNRSVMAEEYPLSSILNNNEINAVFMFSDSKFGRNDDIFVDIAQFDEGDFVIMLPKQRDNLDYYRSFFRAVKLEQLSAPHGPHSILVAEGFDFASYKEKILKPIINKLYSHPRILNSGCYMDRYGITPE